MQLPIRPALCAGLLAPLAASIAVANSTPLPSSHREAPFIAERPAVDGTDFYMFTSYEQGREDYVTLIANYLPLQDAYGGPNYFRLDPDARYEIKIDNDGDAVEDLTFRFRSGARLRALSLPVGNPGEELDVAVPLTNIGTIAPDQLGALNTVEWFTLDLVQGSGPSATSTPIAKAGTGSTTFGKPVDNIGTKSIPDYAAYADSFVSEIALPDGSVGRVFVGQRKESFVVNLGETFDLINTNPLGPVDGEENTLEDKNITSFILELPKSFLSPRGAEVIGGWTTSSLPKTVTLSANPSFQRPEVSQPLSGFQQVSRLSMPLVNEVVIGLEDKNRFNASEPADDAQFLDYVTHPTLPELIEILFGVTAPNAFPRNDLVEVFVTGIPGLNQNGGVGEMLRLNLTTPPVPALHQHTLGVIGGDVAGYPNGRRPGDDVVDISLRVVMGVLLDASVAPDGQLPYTDGAALGASDFDDSFPYLRDPLPGSPN
ncbi:MAG: DUF4331 domain-containing protein [Planctomycetota bacterium]